VIRTKLIARLGVAPNYFHPASPISSMRPPLGVAQKLPCYFCEGDCTAIQDVVTGQNCTFLRILGNTPPIPVGTSTLHHAMELTRVPRRFPVYSVSMPMTVEEGTPIKVALDSEVRIRAPGQTIQGRTTEPVYAFDKLLIPVGSVVNCKVSAIDPVAKITRTIQAANGNFSPVR